MSTRGARTAGFLLSASLGAFLGGLLVLVASEALPKMASRMMREMMGGMMAQMGGGACNPTEL